MSKRHVTQMSGITSFVTNRYVWVSGVGKKKRFLALFFFNRP